MSKTPTLGDRMKRYESVSNISLIRRTPVVLRLDMSHGHTFTKGFIKPFDEVFMWSMQKTMESLCKDIQGCVFGYTQSDEITLVLTDYQTLETDAWFDYRVEKLCSVASSKATRYFNKYFRRTVDDIAHVCFMDKNKAFGEIYKTRGETEEKNLMTETQYSIYKKVYDTAEFDCRAFNVPIQDVTNCIIWRQNDAERNSVQSLAQSLYSHREIQGMSNNQLQNKMLTEREVNWDSLSICKKRGASCVRDTDGKWRIDWNMPIVKEQRDYVERAVYITAFEE